MCPDLQYHAVLEVAEEHPASNGNVGVGRALCWSSSLKIMGGGNFDQIRPLCGVGSVFCTSGTKMKDWFR